MAHATQNYNDDASLAVENLRRENEDLRTNLRLNKESLQAMLVESQNKSVKETSLIETINIISRENSTLKEQIEALKSEQLRELDTPKVSLITI